MEGWRELVTSGLDLLSFVLVTPELARYGRATARTIMVLSVMAFFWVCPLLISALVWAVLFHDQTWGMVQAVVTFFVWFGGTALLMRIMSTVFRRIGEPSEEFFTRCAFLLGFILFSLSRLIVFLGALERVLAQNS